MSAIDDARNALASYDETEEEWEAVCEREELYGDGPEVKDYEYHTDALEEHAHELARVLRALIPEEQK